MRKVKTTDISASVGMPFKSGTLTHLQLAYQEALTALSKHQLGTVNNTTAYVLYGCVNSGDLTNYEISAGAVYYNGEIYLVPAAVFSVVGGNVAVGTITTTYYTSASADPVTFTDTVPHNVHEIRQIVIASHVSGSGTANYSNFIFNEWTLADQTSVATVDSGSATITSCFVKYKRIGDLVMADIKITGTQTGVTAVNIFVPLPIEADVPTADDDFASSFYTSVRNTNQYCYTEINSIDPTQASINFNGQNSSGTTVDLYIKGQIIYKSI